MKKIIYILLIAFGITITSCNDFLDTKSPSELTPDITYSSVVYTENVLLGVYSKLTLDKTYGARLALNYATNSDVEIVGADVSSYAQATNRGLSNYRGTPSNTSLDAWQESYALIERANLCVEGIEGSPILQGTDKAKIAKMLAFKGEALTLRALTYFELLRNFGDIPFKTESTKLDGSNIYLPATDRDAIMDTLLVNLQEAEQYVPWVGTESYGSSERITKGFVKGLIARIALQRGGYSIRNKAGYPTERGSDWQKYYELANKECKEIKANGTHKLNPSYKNIFEKLNKLELDQTYNENMFEVAHGLANSGEMGYSIGVRFYANAKYGFGNNSNVVCTTAMYFYSFDQKDLRRDATVAYNVYGNSTGDLKEIMISNPYGFNFAKWDQRMMGNKWLSQNLKASGKAGYGINWVIMRYSDVLLMLAETENALNGGPTDIARAALKEVRTRAFSANDKATEVDAYVDGLSGEEAFFNAIVNERAWEFGGEAVRKYDLIRWNLLMSKIQDSRDQFTRMINKQGEYSFMPATLYFKYDVAGENLQKTDINFYDGTVDKSSDKTYQSVTWFGGMKAADLQKYTEISTVFSNGLQKAVNGTADNRHLYPLSTTIISDSNGKLTNSYGW